MTYGSLFSGAGGFDLGFDAAGFRCCWQVEVDQTCRDVLARHWPDVPRFRDVTGFSRIPRRFGHWLDRWERPDVIIGGFPCQDLSVAGQRKGIEGGSRSGLFYQFARIVRGLRPRFVCWENVPGLLSSDRGGDLLRVVGKLAECGYHGGWRTLDARFFGVPQRRRRVFGVFARTDIGIERVAEVLGFAAGSGRNPSTVRTAGEEIAGTLGGGSDARGWCDDTDRMTFVPAVTSKWAKGSGGPSGDECQNLIAFSSKDYGADAGDICPTLRSMSHHRSHANGGGQVAIACTIPASDGGVSSGVRRLTPTECTRLMGWPDDHTRYRANGAEIADGPRYRMAGNGVVAPVAEWLARRLAKQL